MKDDDEDSTSDWNVTESRDGGKRYQYNLNGISLPSLSLKYVGCESQES